MKKKKLLIDQNITVAALSNEEIIFTMTDKTSPTQLKKQSTRRPQKFRNEWLSNPDFCSWLLPHSDKLKAQCSLCKATITAELTVIRKHATSKSHLIMLKGLNKQTKIASFKDKASNKFENVPMNGTVSRAEIKLCSFFAQHNVPFKIMNYLKPLRQECVPDSDIIKQVRLQSSKSACIIRNVIGFAEKEELASKLQKTPFSVKIDESTDISMTQTLCIIIRYYDECLRRIASNFWELCRIFNDDSKEVSATAEHLFNCVREYFQRFSVSFDKIIGFRSDGCNAMIGKHNVVRTRFKDSCPNIYIMTCICHSLHLCSSKACDAIPFDCEKLFHSIYNHFSSSCKRQHEFKQYQQFLELKSHKILCPVETRWLSVTA
ncbi:PREDICTED: uncharacterized protein LOC107073561, partial [Polistes dominula]|uniref:Uncharacterized protein LOC107073561 n=1 Tax=Polistes dominula TaxID=743375 RepID=A0ABM1JBA3_POLDO